MTFRIVGLSPLEMWYLSLEVNADTWKGYAPGCVRVERCDCRGEAITFRVSIGHDLDKVKCVVPGGDTLVFAAYRRESFAALDAAMLEPVNA